MPAGGGSGVERLLCAQGPPEAGTSRSAPGQAQQPVLRRGSWLARPAGRLHLVPGIEWRQGGDGEPVQGSLTMSFLSEVFTCSQWPAVAE